MPKEKGRRVEKRLEVIVIWKVTTMRRDDDLGKRSHKEESHVYDRPGKRPERVPRSALSRCLKRRHGATPHGAIRDGYKYNGILDKIPYWEICSSAKAHSVVFFFSHLLGYEPNAVLFGHPPDGQSWAMRRIIGYPADLHRQTGVFRG